jgi:oxygen-independent coproporphyrinogen-3 oxidase
MPKGRGLYLSLPWDRAVVPDEEERFADAVRREAALLRASGLSGETRVVSFAVGGGDPLALSARGLGSLLRGVEAEFSFANGCERTCEGAVRSFGAVKLTALREAGFDRICMKEADGEGPERIAAAARGAREAGFPTIALDLPLDGKERGLLDGSVVDWRTIDHVSLREPRGAAPSEGEWVRRYRRAAARLEESGIKRYEITHFARPGKRSRALRLLHAGGDVIGLGPGALTSVGPMRRRNEDDPIRYGERLREGILPVREEEHLDNAARALERLFLGLRRSGGVDPRTIGRGLCPDRSPLPEEAIARLIEGGFLRGRGGRIFLSERGIVRADRIAVELLP